MESKLIAETIESDYSFLLDILGDETLEIIERRAREKEDILDLQVKTGGENFDIHFDINMAFEICNTVFGAVGFYRMLFKTEASERLASKVLDLLNREQPTSILNEDEVKKIVQRVIDNSSNV